MRTRKEYSKESAALVMKLLRHRIGAERNVQKADRNELRYTHGFWISDFWTGMLISSLHEYHQGCILTSLKAGEIPSSIHPTSRFLRKSVFSYLHAYYCTKGALVLPILRELGRSDLADSISTNPNRDVGGLTLLELIAISRNKDLAHPLFDFGTFKAVHRGDPELMSKASATDDLTSCPPAKALPGCL